MVTFTVLEMLSRTCFSRRNPARPRGCNVEVVRTSGYSVTTIGRCVAPQNFRARKVLLMFGLTLE
jgi:hypothetical protein